MPQGLSIFVKSAIGQKVVIEFKDESAVWGPVEDCDESMNISLGQSLYFKRRVRTGPPLQLNQFFARSRYIRFIHLDVSPAVVKRYNLDHTKEPLRRLASYLSDYSVIQPRLRSLYFSDSTSRSHLSFRAFEQEFIIILNELNKPPGVQGNFQLLDGNGNERNMFYYPVIRYYEAFLERNLVPIGSFSIDYDSGSIMGHFDIEDETYFVEQIDSSNETIIYKASDVKYDEIKDHVKSPLMVPECLKKASVFEVLRRKKRQELPPAVKKNRCEMKIVADYDFYKVIGNRNYYKAARHLINVVERVNALFKKIDFGINAEREGLRGLGFVIKEIKIYDKPYNGSDSFHFNMDVSSKPEGIFWANDTLNSYSIVEGGKSVCVSVIFTAKVFADGILGLANIGHIEHADSNNFCPRTGLCATEPRSADGCYCNTAIVTVKKKNGLMITRIFDLVFAHELGHLWGSDHDDGGKCFPEEYSGERFIMHSSSNTGYDKNNYVFSKCSIRYMFRILYSTQPECFVEEEKSLCGNGILEPGEECDGGGRYADSEDIRRKDSCCANNCKLKPGALCSPRHSDCCSDICDYLPKKHICVQKNDDTCRNESYCTGVNSNCPEPPYSIDGTICSDEGTCKNGACISFCEMRNPNYQPCICENLSDSCYRCCKDRISGKCEAVRPRIPLKDGSVCSFGYCKNKICEKEVTDIVTHFWKLIKNINKTPRNKLFGDYAVFLVVVISLAIWIPCSIIVCRRDKRMLEEQSMKEAPIEYVHGTRKIVRQIAIESQEEPDDHNHIESTA